MTIKISHLVVNGCSFTYCQGLKKPSEQGWPAILAKKLNVPVVNISCKGSGNDSILRRTTQYFYKDNYKNFPFYIVCFSQALRREEYVIKYQNKDINGFYQLSSFSTEPIEKALYENYNERGIISQEEKKLIYWASVVNLFKSNNINYLVSDFMPEHDTKIYDAVKQKNAHLVDILHNDVYNVKDLNSVTKNLPKLPCGHDGYEAQDFIAEFFFRKIQEKYNDFIHVSENYIKTKDFLPVYAESDYLRQGNDWCN